MRTMFRLYQAMPTPRLWGVEAFSGTSVPKNIGIGVTTADSQAGRTAP
jgi:hypothetical protein